MSAPPTHRLRRHRRCPQCRLCARRLWVPMRQRLLHGMRLPRFSRQHQSMFESSPCMLLRSACLCSRRCRWVRPGLPTSNETPTSEGLSQRCRANQRPVVGLQVMSLCQCSTLTTCILSCERLRRKWPTCATSLRTSFSRLRQMQTWRRTLSLWTLIRHR